MNKSVLISIKPKWCEMIISGKKTIEVRKTRPNLKPPFKSYIYCTKETTLHRHILWGDEYRKPSKDLLVRVPRSGDICFIEQPIINEEYRRNIMNGKVIGEFVCDKIDTYLYGGITRNEYWINGREFDQTCLSYEELIEYGNGKTLYGWHISDLKIYDKPKELSEFRYSIKCQQAELNNYDGEWYCNDGYTKNATVDRSEVFPYNEECIYFNCLSVGGENSEYEDYAYCMCNGYKPLTRPPQSWQYVIGDYE